jgi:hypothetical protein
MRALWVLILAGCYFPYHPGYEHEQVPGIEIISGAAAAERGLVGRPLAVDFATKQDGTQVLVDFLARARALGAHYVSDVGIALRVERDGRPVECRTRILPEATTVTTSTLAAAPGTGQTRSRYVMRPVTQYVTEYEYRCHMEVRSVSRMETTYTTEYDFLSHTSHMVPRTQYVSHLEPQQECRSEPVSHMVTRYENQLELEYVPPRLEMIRGRYTKWELRETDQECAVVDTGGGENRIEGTIY